MRVRSIRYCGFPMILNFKIITHVLKTRSPWAPLKTVTFHCIDILTLFRPEGGGGALEAYQTLKLNNFKAVKAMTTKFSDFS